MKRSNRKRGRAMTRLSAAAAHRARIAQGISAAQLRYTPYQAQVILSVANTKFWRLVKDGRIRVYKDGARAFIDRAELERYAASRRPAP